MGQLQKEKMDYLLIYIILQGKSLENYLKYKKAFTVSLD